MVVSHDDRKQHEVMDDNEGSDEPECGKHNAVLIYRASSFGLYQPIVKYWRFGLLVASFWEARDILNYGFPIKYGRSDNPVLLPAFHILTEQRADIRPQNISLKLVANRHFAPDASEWPHEKIVEELHKITHVRLDRERIASLDNLLLFSINVTNVYLQHNLIEKLDGLECLINVRFLTLAHNRIQNVDGLKNLSHLCFLDLSHNKIASVNKDGEVLLNSVVELTYNVLVHAGDLPQSLVILTLKDNPCTVPADYSSDIAINKLMLIPEEVKNKLKSNLLQLLPRLKQLDDVAVDDDDDNTEGDDDEIEDDVCADQSAKRLPDADVSLQSAANGILLRSQHYLEQQFSQHRNRLHQLDDIRSATPTDLALNSSRSRSFLT